MQPRRRHILANFHLNIFVCMVPAEEKHGSDDPESVRTEEPVGDYVLLGKLKIKYDELRRFSLADVLL